VKQWNIGKYGVVAHKITLPMLAICKTNVPTGRNYGNADNYKQKPGDVMLRNDPVSLPRTETHTDG
jgi:hypothetical protein